MRLVVDDHSAHRSRKVRDGLTQHADRVEPHLLPPYSPELNPDEPVNADLTRSLPTPSRAQGRAELAAQARRFFHRRQRQPHIVRGYLGGPHVRYILEERPPRSARWYHDHPKAVWISQRPLLEAVQHFFAERIVGPDRVALWEREVAAATRRQPDDTASETDRLRREATRLQRRQERLLDQLATADDDGDPATAAAFRKGVRDRFDRIERERRTVLDQLARHTESTPATPSGDPGLLAALPRLPTEFPRLPEGVRRELYAAFQLQVRYDPRDRGVKLRATVTPDLAARVTEITTPTGDGAAPGDVDQPIRKCPRQDSNLRPSA